MLRYNHGKKKGRWRGAYVLKRSKGEQNEGSIAPLRYESHGGRGDGERERIEQ